MTSDLSMITLTERERVLLASLAVGMLERLVPADFDAEQTLDRHTWPAWTTISAETREPMMNLSVQALSVLLLVVTIHRALVGSVEIPATGRHVDWRVGDPAGAPFDEVRRVREDIERRVDALVAELPTMLS